MKPSHARRDDACPAKVSVLVITEVCLVLVSGALVFRRTERTCVDVL